MLLGRWRQEDRVLDQPELNREYMAQLDYMRTLPNSVKDLY